MANMRLIKAKSKLDCNETWFLSIINYRGLQKGGIGMTFCKRVGFTLLFVILVFFSVSCSTSSLLYDPLAPKKNGDTGATLKGRIILEESSDYSDVYMRPDVNGVGLSRQCNSDGTFELSNYAYGNYPLAISKRGWYTSYVSVSVGNRQEISLGDIHLHKMHYELSVKRASSNYHVALTWKWNDALRNFVGINIYREEVGAQFSQKQLNEGPIAANSYSDSIPNVEKSYNYWITAVVSTPSGNVESKETLKVNVPAGNISVSSFIIPPFDSTDVLVTYKNGNVYVQSTSETKTYQYNEQGSLIRTISLPDTRSGNFGSRRSLSFDSNGHLIESTSALPRLYEFDSEGNFLEAFVVSQDANEMYSVDYSALDSNDNLYVLGSLNYERCFVKLDKSNKFISILPMLKSQDFDVKNVILRKDVFYVLNSGNATIDKFSLDGVKIGQINLKKDNGEVYYSLGFDMSEQFIYLWQQYSILVYTFDGSFVTSIGSGRQLTSIFERIKDIAIGENNKIYVVDRSDKMKIISF